MRDTSQADKTARARARDARGGRSGIEQILAQQAAVAEIGQRALGERSIEALLDDVSELVRRTLGADLVSIMQLDPDGEWLTMVAGSGWADGVVGTLRLRAETGSMSGYTLLTGGPVIVDDFGHESRFSVAEALRRHGAVSAMAVRIGEVDRPFGALGTFTTSPRLFTSDDANFLQSVANVIAGAVAAVRAEADLRRSRDELAAIVASVTDGITVQGRDGRLAFANDAAARLTGYPTAAALVAAPIAEVLARFEMLDEAGRPFPLDRLPGRRALAGQEAEATLVRFRIRATGEERWSIVQASPIRSEDGGVAQVVNVFRDITDAKRAADSHTFMTDALEQMGNTLDPAEAARRLADACVPAMADYCVVDLLEPDGSITMAALVAADPEKSRLARRLRETRSLTSDASGPAQVIRDGTSVMTQITAQMLTAATTSPAELDVLLNLGLRSYMCVPLLARGRPIGALSLVTADSGRTFDQSDLLLAEELAARAGAAIENARLYEAVDDRRAELDAVLSAMAEAVLVFDAQGRLRLSNRAADRLFGGSVPDTSTALATRLEPVEGDDGSRPVGLAEMGTEVQLPGSGRWLEMRRYRAARTGADRAERHAPYVVVLRDVTAARAANAARDAFLGLLSHELRTPITTIYGGSQLLERDLDPERRVEVVQDIKAESERLARLVEDLLVMTRVERGGLEIGDEPVLVQRVLPPLAEALQARWPGLNLAMEVGEALPAVRGDVTYLEQILRNLLTNSIRYGGALETGVTVKVDEDEATAVVVRVLDRGPGLGAEEPERLFNLFYRSPSARSVPGGAGIGLFVCRHLVEAMGGRIWARPREGGGAEFGFALPVIEADAG